MQEGLIPHVTGEKGKSGELGEMEEIEREMRSSPFVRGLSFKTNHQ